MMVSRCGHSPLRGAIVTASNYGGPKHRRGTTTSRRILNANRATKSFRRVRSPIPTTTHAFMGSRSRSSRVGATIA